MIVCRRMNLQGTHLWETMGNCMARTRGFQVVEQW
jgi:hypothetical protein